MTVLCVCGHSKESHIYNEGACRPGFKCEKDCHGFKGLSPHKLHEMADGDSKKYLQLMIDYGYVIKHTHA